MWNVKGPKKKWIKSLFFFLFCFGVCVSLWRLDLEQRVRHLSSPPSGLISLLRGKLAVQCLSLSQAQASPFYLHSPESQITMPQWALQSVQSVRLSWMYHTGLPFVSFTLLLSPFVFVSRLSFSFYERLTSLTFVFILLKILVFPLKLTPPPNPPPPRVANLTSWRPDITEWC